MARTKQTARKKKEMAESTANTDPHDLEIDTADKETETMDTENENCTDQDRNTEACLLRTRMEEKFKETVYHFYLYKGKKSETPIRRENMKEREEIDPNLNKFLILKVDLAEDFQRTICPNPLYFDVATHTDDIEIERDYRE
ncbi:hypothetical protein NPIL_413141 [Nephila pilipes]|uniref:Uncharacterized protein n=1 Tax=Nephila pilipes TaxID=299642 RepID=A0A8X6TJX5_NEPPI|nr:hypothetical protein NPIL_413141 [Nephila pilipes]